MKHQHSTFLALTMMALAGPALAQDGNAALQRCRALSDSAARLACYDAIPLAPVTAAIAAKAPIAPAPATIPMTVAPEAKPQAAAASTPATQFGLTAKATNAEPDSIESRIDGLFEGWDSGSLIRLANGQVWRIDDGSSASYSLQSPKVKIRKGVFGAFVLEVAGANRTPKVRRIK